MPGKQPPRGGAQAAGLPLRSRDAGAVGALTSRLDRPRRAVSVGIRAPRALKAQAAQRDELALTAERSSTLTVSTPAAQ